MKRWTWTAPLLSLALFASSTAFAAGGPAPAAHVATPAEPAAAAPPPGAAAPSAALKQHVAALATVVHPLIGGRPDAAVHVPADAMAPKKADGPAQSAVVFQRNLPEGQARLAFVRLDSEGRPTDVTVAHQVSAAEGRPAGMVQIARMPWAAAVRAHEEGLGQASGATPLPPPMGFVKPDPSGHQVLLFAADDKGTRNSGSIRVEQGRITGVESVAAPFHTMMTARGFGLGALTEERAGAGGKTTDFVFQRGTVHMTTAADGSRTIAGVALRPRDAANSGEVEVPKTVFDKARGEKLGPLVSTWTGAAPREGSHEPIGFGTPKEPRTFVFAKGILVVDPNGRIMNFQHVSE